LEEIIGLIEDFDKTYSRFRFDSVVTQMAHRRKAAWVIAQTALVDENNRLEVSKDFPG
jgi:hypothetical protein